LAPFIQTAGRIVRVGRFRTAVGECLWWRRSRCLRISTAGHADRCRVGSRTSRRSDPD